VLATNCRALLSSRLTAETKIRGLGFTGVIDYENRPSATSLDSSFLLVTIRPNSLVLDES